MPDPARPSLDRPVGSPPRRRGDQTRVAAAAGLAIVLAVGLYASTRPIGRLFGPAGSSSPGPSGSAARGIGGPAPDFVEPDGSATLRGLDDRPIRLADFAGRPLWIVFWATWCIPCQDEAPFIEAAFEGHAPDDLAVLAIDVQEPTAAVRDFAASRVLSYAIGLDPTGAVMASYGVPGLPSHVFVDRAGVMRDRYAGQLTATTMEQHLRSILGP